jgi:hypothetical protein
MCEQNDNVTPEVEREIENISDEAMAEIVRIVGDELAKHQDFMVASILEKFGVKEVTLDADSASALKMKMELGQVKLDGAASEDDSTFTFKIVESEGFTGLDELFKALLG